MSVKLLYILHNTEHFDHIPHDHDFIKITSDMLKKKHNLTRDCKMTQDILIESVFSYRRS